MRRVMKKMIFRILLRLIISITVPTLCLAADQSKQNVIGISPSVLPVEIVQGTTVERQLVISRSNASGEQSFTSTVSGNRSVNLYLPASVMIPIGEQQYSVPVTIDATKAVLGEQNVLVTFTLNDNTLKDGTGAVVKYGVAAKLKVTVVQPTLLGLPYWIWFSGAVILVLVVSALLVKRQLHHQALNQRAVHSAKNSGINTH